jgi:HlyD family secretion protein
LVTFDAIDNLIATGTVRVVDLVGTVSQGVVSYNIKISIDSQDSRIRPGMSVNATITTDKREGVLVVPSSSVKTQGKIKYVETVVYDGNATNLSTTAISTSTRKNTFAPITVETTPTKMTVETGISNDTSTEIISGINPGTYVVTKTISGTSQKNSATPSILSSIGSGARNTTRVPGATR